jgi:hypothetical protein
METTETRVDLQKSSEPEANGRALVPMPKPAETAQTERRQRALTRDGVVAVAAWIALFAAGLLVDSAPFRAVFSTAKATELSMTAGIQMYGVAFIACILFYTPLNVAMLVLVSGFVGGCTSAIMYRKPGETAERLAPEQARRLSFLTEHPVVSMLRAFLVIIAVYAGLYVTSGDVFASTSPAQYAKYACSLSALAFVVGYDPTKFQDLIELIPAAGTKSS